jgi:hypothetical protein
MRQTLMLATMAVMTACGATGNTPWDQNHDGLITACEGLNPLACSATAGCERVATACTMICRDDGHGGCVPCEAVDACRPTPPSQVGCNNLPASLCAAMPMCELVQETVCSGSTTPAGPNAPGCATPPDSTQCHTTSACINRRPVQCESLSNQVCLSHPGCALGPSGVACACDSNGNCPPCVEERCVTAPPPDVCGSRDANTCAMDGRCVLESGPVCDVLCDPNGACPPCAMPQPRCVPAPPPDLCGARDQNSCAADGRCMLEPGPLCVCSPDGVCPPCAAPSVRCVPVPPVDECGARDQNSCAADGRCMLEPGPLCVCSADGVCPPCAAPSVRCVPVPPVDVCAGRDPTSCEVDGRCVIQAWACAQVCQPDGNGGCLPCNAPPALCVPAPVSRCEGIDDAAACTAAGCNLMPLGIACTTDCRDDGHGGCLPCKEFACVDPSTSGGGTPPPSPRP